MRNLRLMLLVIGLAATLSAADPFVGVWKLNVAKSNFQSGPVPDDKSPPSRNRVGRHESKSMALQPTEPRRWSTTRFPPTAA